MKRLVLISFLFISVNLFSQDYNNAIGLRAAAIDDGNSWGVTFKHFSGEKKAIEALLYTRQDGFIVTGLLEKHSSIETERLRWFYGYGAHFGYWGNGYGDDGNMKIGVDGIIGLEFTFTEAPINLGLDWKPAFNIIEGTDFWGADFALSIRYVLN